MFLYLNVLFNNNELIWFVFNEISTNEQNVVKLPVIILFITV